MGRCHAPAALVAAALSSSPFGADRHGAAATRFENPAPARCHASVRCSMHTSSNYLKMRVLGAFEFAEGSSLQARYKAVSQMVFRDEDGQPRQFTWRTIQTWWWYYRRHGVTHPPERSDKGRTRKVSPERLLEVIEQVLLSFHGKKYNIAEVYRACIEKGLLRREEVAPNTFRRIVNRFDLLKPADDNTPKARLAFAKAHANDMWQADTLHGPYIRIDGKPVKTFLICFIDDASRVISHGCMGSVNGTRVHGLTSSTSLLIRLL